MWFVFFCLSVCLFFDFDFFGIEIEFLVRKSGRVKSPVWKDWGRNFKPENFAKNKLPPPICWIRKYCILQRWNIKRTVVMKERTEVGTSTHGKTSAR